jgi:large subunit ribosomal protein L32e
MKKKFLRRVWSRYSKLGKRRKKKQVWRKPKGRDNKMREKRKGYPVVVSIGYKRDTKLRKKIKEKQPIIIMNTKDLEKINNNQIAIIGKIGKKKKIEIAEKAKEKKIQVHNLDIDKFLKKKIKPKEEKKK